MGKTSFKEGQVGIQGAPKKGTCLAAANQSLKSAGRQPIKADALWLAGT